MRRLYHAVQVPESLDTNFLFPSQSTKRSIKMTQIVPFTPLNEEQQRAVETILGCRGAPPYGIHGPQGQVTKFHFFDIKMAETFLFLEKSKQNISGVRKSKCTIMLRKRVVSTLTRNIQAQ